MREKIIFLVNSEDMDLEEMVDLEEMGYKALSSVTGGYKRGENIYLKNEADIAIVNHGSSLNEIVLSQSGLAESRKVRRASIDSIDLESMLRVDEVEIVGVDDSVSQADLQIALDHAHDLTLNWNREPLDLSLAQMQALVSLGFSRLYVPLWAHKMSRKKTDVEVDEKKLKISSRSTGILSPELIRRGNINFDVLKTAIHFGSSLKMSEDGKVLYDIDDDINAVIDTKGHIGLSIDREWAEARHGAVPVLRAEFEYREETATFEIVSYVACDAFMYHLDFQRFFRIVSYLQFDKEMLEDKEHIKYLQ